MSIESPCNSNCCLDNDGMCLGCHRTIEEIINWSAYKENEKKEILAKCVERKQKNKEITH